MASERPHDSIRFLKTPAPRWQELRGAYPRIAACFALAFAVLILADLSLILKNFEFSREHEFLLSALSRADTARAAAEGTTKGNLSATTIRLARREALLAKELHLAIDRERSVMYLRRDGLILREMPVRLVRAGGTGAQAAAGSQAQAARLAVPPGRQVVISVVDDSMPGKVPESGAPVTGDGLPAGAPGTLTVILDSGAVITTQDAADPARDGSGLPPGSIGVETADLEAIKANLQPGMKVYFY